MYPGNMPLWRAGNASSNSLCANVNLLNNQASTKNVSNVNMVKQEGALVTWPRGSHPRERLFKSLN